MSVITKDDFSLPPPPTRSRKIIQMKPRELEQDATQQTAATGASGKTSNTTTQSGKKTNGKSTTAAGRKIARKTAHSDRTSKTIEDERGIWSLEGHDTCMSRARYAQACDIVGTCHHESLAFEVFANVPTRLVSNIYAISNNA
jgi:hypothetical protein